MFEAFRGIMNQHIFLCIIDKIISQINYQIS